MTSKCTQAVTASVFFCIFHVGFIYLARLTQPRLPTDKKKMQKSHRASKDKSVRKMMRKETRCDREIPLNQWDEPVPLTRIS